MATESEMTILVVDDNPAGRYATSRVLRAAGFAVLEAGTGEEGATLAEQADLVVLDVNLPDISGFEVCRRIRSIPETAWIPVIHLSATFVRDTDKVQGLEAGADGYLTHPVEPPVLVATVNAFLRARRAEDEMRRSEAKFRAIFDQALLGILLVSRDLVYLEVNPAMCRILGRSREEIVGRHASTFLPAGEENNTVAIARELEERGVWRGTSPMIRADGSHVELEWNIARHSIPGVRLAIVNDITERKAIEAERERLHNAERSAREEAERANRLKDEFLATLSHELRTPLNAIMGWVQILKSGHANSEDLKEGVEVIQRNAQAQTQLISDLLDVSRITSGQLRLDVRTIDPATVIRGALETIAHAIQAKNIRLKLTLDPHAGPIKGDPDRLQQVIWNLVSNAVKFTPKGGSIAVSLARENSHVSITIADNGQGIKADFLPHIFERFRQEDASSRRNKGGLGLGLAIVKNLVEMHGGTVAATSEGEGKGTSFFITLPIAAIHHTAATEPSPQTPPAGEHRPLPAKSHPVDLSGIEIVVVEDDPDARSVLHRILTTAGANVRDAANVPAGLAHLAEFPPDLLISDIGMPSQDGYDLIKAVRAMPGNAHLPAIALTAFARREDRRHSFQAGFQLHFAKPVDAEELLAAVASLARKHTPQT